MTYHAKVIAGGKIVIPAELRRELGISDGDTLVIERDGHGTLTVKTYTQVVREVQQTFKAMVGSYEGSMVDELIADRRREAALEDETLARWQAERQPR
jgi:AbrB family looped-hinge helix DNA binding protein